MPGPSTELFRICTDRVSIHWAADRASAVSGAVRSAGNGVELRPSGKLRILLRGRNVRLLPETRRLGVPGELAARLDVTAGPPLFEETPYFVLARSVQGGSIEVKHRDPVIEGGLSKPGDPALLHGSVNFRGQIGDSRFVVLVDGEVELEFIVEVFPSKMTYREDFSRMLSRVQDISAGLALEYLRSTHHLAGTTESTGGTRLEWVSLLRVIVLDLEKALRHVASHPIRGLQRAPRPTRVEAIRRLDSGVRRAILRGGGSGSHLRTKGGVPIRRILPTRASRSTLDTHEHRWLALQLDRIQLRLADLLREEVARLEERYGDQSQTDRKVLEELRGIEARVVALRELEPLRSTTALPPPGFASLQLQSAPGYREASRAIVVLNRGLRIGGGPFELSLKDLHQLYEYWCYLELLSLVATVVRRPIPTKGLVEVTEQGLRVRLDRGRARTVRFDLSGRRRLEVTYNPLFPAGDGVLPQQPDIVLTITDPQWPDVRLILDAKYRVRAEPSFIDRFGSPGPPEDAINVLHRYRDAIVEEERRSGPESQSFERRRTVVEGVALFPLSGKDVHQFRNSRFFTSLEKLGIGALPFLPGATDLVEDWLRAVLKRSGWATAARTVDYSITRRASRWAREAEEAVLLGVLRPTDPMGHLDWVRDNRTYYTPLTPTQERQLLARWIGLYTPASARGKGLPGAVTHVAPVEGIEVAPRSRVQAPWPPRKHRKALQVVYRLGEVLPLSRPILNRDPSTGRGSRFSTNRWTSRLALDRAREVTELLLESRAEWILVETLRARGEEFSIRADRAPSAEVGNTGRARFHLDHQVVRWAGDQGWEIDVGGRKRYAHEVM